MMRIMIGILSRTHRYFNNGLRLFSTANFYSIKSDSDAAQDWTNLVVERLNPQIIKVDEKEVGREKELPLPTKVLLAEAHGWRCLRGSETGLEENLIPESAWKVLRLLRTKGVEAYLVGGSVRDLLLKRTPKDFDILTTADPKEVKKYFARIMRCMIVGRRFPICHVYSLGAVIEVSSFSTTSSLNHQMAISNSSKPAIDRDLARWKNCMKRDFTVNALLYDPFGHVLYDYVGGLRDLKERKLRTIVPAAESFEEDSGRLLRAIRIAARLGLRLSKDIACAIRAYTSSLGSINKARLMAEIDMMMAYGAAEPSFRLLWRFEILHLLLPLQASYFASQRFNSYEPRSNFLLVLLRNLDSVVAPDRACHSSLWVALLAFHLALEKVKRSHIVVAAGALSICYQDTQQAAAKTRKVKEKLKQGECVVIDSYSLDAKDFTEDIIQEKANQLLDDAAESLRNMVDESFLQNAMQRHSKHDGSEMISNAPPKVLVVVPKAVCSKVCSLFLGAKSHGHKTDTNKKLWRHMDDNSRNEALTNGDIAAVGYVFSCIVLNTLYPPAKTVQSVLP